MLEAKPGDKVRVEYPASWRGWWAIEDTDGRAGEVVYMGDKVVLSETSRRTHCYVRVAGHRHPELFAREHLKPEKVAV